MWQNVYTLPYRVKRCNKVLHTNRPHTPTPPDRRLPAHVSVTSISILLLIPPGMCGMADLHFADTSQTFWLCATFLLHGDPPLFPSYLAVRPWRLTLSLIPPFLDVKYSSGEPNTGAHVTRWYNVWLPLGWVSWCHPHESESTYCARSICLSANTLRSLMWSGCNQTKHLDWAQRSKWHPWTTDVSQSAAARTCLQQ